jgi:FixJ family two-component response regulator
MKEGAIDFLQKPVDERELLGGIHQALNRSRQARAALAEQAELEGRLAALTAREREVPDLVVTGMLNKQIGERLGVAEKTIKVHRGRVMQKMAAASVADLVRMFHKLGLELPRAPGGRRVWDQRPMAEDQQTRAE